MAVSKVEIVNRALTLIGASPIVSLDDDTKNARITNRIYDSTLKDILSETHWNFATKRVLLATLAVTQAWTYAGEAYTYQLPSDIITIISTNDRSASWRIEGETIVSDTSGLGIKYIYFQEDPTKYTVKFVTAFADLLAVNLTFMVTNSTTGVSDLFSKYQKFSLPSAMGDNARQGTQQQMQDSEWELAKYGNSAGDTGYFI